MKTCDEVKDILPEMLPLVSGAALEVQEHISRCPDCAELRDELAHTLHVLESSPGADELPEAFAAEVMSRLPDDPGWSLAAPPPRGQLVSYPRAFLHGVAAAACFVAGAAVAWNLRGSGDHGFGPAVAGEPLRAVERRPAQVVAAPRQTPMIVVEEPAAATAAAPRSGRPGRGQDAWGYALDRRQQEVAATGRPLVRYVSQAGVLLEAVADLEAGDPRSLQVLTVNLQGSDLLDRGDELLRLIAVEAGDPGQVELFHLIAGTQLVLRKVRNARHDASPEMVWALRREVRETGLLDAYRQLLVSDPAPRARTDEPF